MRHSPDPEMNIGANGFIRLSKLRVMFFNGEYLYIFNPLFI